MSTSAEKTWLKKALTQLYITIFTAVFGAIYEHFSFGVYSYYMLYAFAIPLLLGALPYTLAAFRGGRTPQLRGTRFWTAGIITLTLGSVMQGVFAIAGYSNRLITVYLIAGALLLAIGLIAALPRRDRAEDEA